MCPLTYLSDFVSDHVNPYTLQVSWAVYKSYFSAAGRRSVVAAGLLSLMSVSFGLGSNICLSLWTGDDVFKDSANSTDSEKEDVMGNYLAIFTSLGISNSECVGGKMGEWVGVSHVSPLIL